MATVERDASPDVHPSLRFRKINCKNEFWDCFASLHFIRKKVRWPPAVCIPFFPLSLSLCQRASLSIPLFSSLALALSLPGISVTQSTSVCVCVCVSLSLSLPTGVPPRKGTQAERGRERERERPRHHSLATSQHQCGPVHLLTNPF